MATGQLSGALQYIRRMLGGAGGSDATDRELLERYAADRDEAAFTALVERHGPLVLGACRRVLANPADADDAFQATFVLLARKAAAVRWHDSVASWLYQAAYRIASKLRVQAARRQRHEAQAMPSRPVDGPPAVDWHEVSRLIDDELQRLPDRFRLPVVLCCLNGLSRDEAARQLGWSLGTVKGRLERGREQLRERLTRRGLPFSAALLGTLLAQGVVNAVPAPLVLSTVQAAASGAISASVAALVQGAMHAMLWKKLKLVTAAVLATLVLGGLFYAGSGSPPSAKATPLPDNVPEDLTRKKPVAVNGLAAVMKPTKLVFAAGERPTCEITYTNQTGKPIPLKNLGYEVRHWTCTDLTTGMRWKAGPYHLSGPPARSVNLEPGESTTQQCLVLEPFVDDRPNRDESLPPRQSLAPGKYRVTCQIGFAVDQIRVSSPPHWIGDFETHSVEFEIAAEKPAPAKASE